MTSLPSGTSLADYARSELVRLVLQREFAPGSPVVEERLAEVLSISRTPLREALARLQAEGLLVKGRRSYQVRVVTAREFFQSMRVRELLEPEMVELALGRAPAAEAAAVRSQVEALTPGRGTLHEYWDADNSVHELFARYCANETMATIVRTMRMRARLFEASNPFGRAAADKTEHLAVLTAFEQGERRIAAKSMVRHIRNLQRDVMRFLRGGRWDPASSGDVSGALSALSERMNGPPP